ncbi:MAG: hypothetical protein ACK5P5_00605 [Pseudobdellovibrionaceae bacterium]
MYFRVVSILVASLIGAAQAQAYLVPGPGSGSGGHHAPNPPNYGGGGHYNPGYPHNNNGAVNLGPNPYPEYGPSYPTYPTYPSYPSHPYNPPHHYEPPYNPPYTPPYYPPTYNDYEVSVPVNLGSSWSGTVDLSRYVDLRDYRGMRLVAVEVDGQFTNYNNCNNGRWDLIVKINGSLEGQGDFCGNSVAVISASEYIDGNERITLSVLSPSIIYSIRLIFRN